MIARASNGDGKVRLWHGDANWLRGTAERPHVVILNRHEPKCAYCAGRLSVYLRDPSVDYMLPRSTMK